MMTMREVEILVGGVWQQFDGFAELREGDVFRLWECDIEGNRNALVACPKCGCTKLVAKGAPYMAKEGVLSIQADFEAHSMPTPPENIRYRDWQEPKDDA